MKVGLGAVQFGVDYGISNKAGKTSALEAVKILEAAAEQGVRVIDTASLYGNSEEVLGLSLPPEARFDIVTKTPQFAKQHIDKNDAQHLEETFRLSLKKLRKPSVYGLLVHRADDLFADGGSLLMDKMQEIKESGAVKKIGVSIYSGQQIDKILEQYSIDLIQLPINILDQRLLRSGHLQKLKQAGVEVHARSIFLQGLLLMDQQSLPPHFDGVREHLKCFHRFIQDRGLTPIQAALGFGEDIPEIDCVICGINNHQQLQEICMAAQIKVKHEDYAQFAIENELILNPSNWRVEQQ